jgi:hypothetical protein
MKNLITKRNMTILNLVLLCLFLGTVVAVGYPLIKSEEDSFSITEERKVSPEPRQEPAREEKIFACPKHPEMTFSSPGKCPKCGSELEEVDKYAAIVERDLFNDPRLRPVREVKPPPVPPLKLELVGVTTVGPDRFVAVIRDRGRREKTGYAEYILGEGEEIPNHFGVTITSITADPPCVKYDRIGVGEEELKMGEEVAGTPKEEWSKIIVPVRPGYTYGVRYRDLQEMLPGAEVYRGTFGLEPVTEGTRITGLKITSLPTDNLLYAAGLRTGDEVKTINGSPVTDEASAMSLLQDAAKGFTIQVGIVRGRTTRAITYTLHKK